MATVTENPRDEWLNDPKNITRICSDYSETDIGNARRLSTRYKEILRFVPGLGWCVLDGGKWVFDERLIMKKAKENMDCILDECREIKNDFQNKKRHQHYLKSQQLPRILAMLRLAQSEPEFTAEADQFDTWQDHINAPNGIIDLRTGELIKHNKDAYFSKATGCEYDPEASCPVFMKFIEQIIPDSKTRDYVHKATGYSLTGHTDEQVLHYSIGDGGNGKSVLLESLLEAAGGFGATISHENFVVSKTNNTARPSIAKLPGIRFLLTSETDESSRLNESLVKDLTAGDKTEARNLYSAPFEFIPRFKLWIRGNYLPRIKGTDEGIWRRVRVIPFIVKIEKENIDKRLREKIKVELPGVLNWMVKGAIKYYQEGLEPVESVNISTAKYREQMDITGRFISECCLTGRDMKASPSGLYRAFVKWAHSAGEFPMSERKFAVQLEKRGFERGRSNGKRWIRGIGLLDNSAGSDGQ